MGTNYYIRSKICEHCERYEEKHIGKYSAGRDFTIRHHSENYNSWMEFKKYLKDKRIFNEYGEEQDYKVFIDFIEMKRKNYPFAHRNKSMSYHDSYGKYIDGYYFLSSDFC